jgi:excisionase family DNA binding protein
MLSIRDVVDALDSSRSQVNRIIAAGQIRAVKFGSRTLIPSDSLQEFMEALPPASIRPAA